MESSAEKHEQRKAFRPHFKAAPAFAKRSSDNLKEQRCDLESDVHTSTTVFVVRRRVRKGLIPDRQRDSLYCGGAVCSWIPTTSLSIHLKL